MKLRGVWASGDAHGNTKPIVAAIHLMDKISKGQPVNKGSLTKSRKGLPQFFEGDGLSFEGYYFLTKSKFLLPIIFT